MKPPLIVRHRDRAIFERDAVDGFFNRVEYRPRRWWQWRGELYRTNSKWYPVSEKEYDVVARDLVIDELEIMAQRGEL